MTRSFLFLTLALVLFLNLKVAHCQDEENAFGFARLRSNLFAPPLPPLPPTPPTPPIPPRNPLLAAASSPAAASFSTLDTFGETGASNSSLVWQPLPLRATFRPINRGGGTATTATTTTTSRRAREREGLADPVGVISERSISTEPAGPNSDSTSPFSARTFFPTRETSTSSTTRAPPTTSLLDFEPEDELPTRQPMNRFRPPSRPADSSQPTGSGSGFASSSGLGNSLASGELPAPFGVGGGVGVGSGGGGGDGGAEAATTFEGDTSSEVAWNKQERSNNGSLFRPVLTSDCFECICEASTNCNAQSKCQTSDVRHTRCGMFLISYDQWLTTGLSKELVSAEALARDAAADERAFYECVTNRDCAQRLLTNFMQRHQKDCDKDGRIDCYDLAAIHHSGMDQCSSESLLDSQYWSDFNACFGFGR